MTILRRLASIARWIVHRDRVERELDDELKAFVEMAAADRMREGASGPYTRDVKRFRGWPRTGPPRFARRLVSRDKRFSS